MDKASVTRMVILAVALINQILAANNMSPIPIDDAVWEQAISAVFTIGAGFYAAWKNNYIGPKGKKQKRVLKEHGLD